MNPLAEMHDDHYCILVKAIQEQLITIYKQSLLKPVETDMDLHLKIKDLIDQIEELK